jgi:hypothetical protein
MKMKNTSVFRNKSIWDMVITAVLFSILLITASQVESSEWPYSPNGNPVVVDGRILTHDKTGDVSDWVEIAQSGKYSLIIRKNFINIRDNYYGNPQWQYSQFVNSSLSSQYMYSQVRDKINFWFNTGSPEKNYLGIPCTYDVLPLTARLRDYTVQHSATTFDIGTSATIESLETGISKPSSYQVGIGNDVAFALSYGEAANYISKAYYVKYGNPMKQLSNPTAEINYGKISIPAGNYGVWLRSLGDTTSTAPIILNDYSNPGFVYLIEVYITSSTSGLIYPALWVDTAIFESAPKKPLVVTPEPVSVDGRILTKEQTGDTSEWVEIAQSEGFSLIVRKNFVNVNSTDYTTQYCEFGTTANYNTSNAREKINAWFNGLAPLSADNLNYKARLRRFTVQSDVNYVLGTCTVNESLTDGFSRPSIYQVGIGDDVAFALSYGESANFLSRGYYQRLYNDLSFRPSDVLAGINYEKITMPDFGIISGMWLRSLGDCEGTAGSLGNIDYYGVVFQEHIEGNANNRNYIYPALWVGNGIFEEDEATINVFHRDEETGELLEPQETDIVQPGKYGPYNAKVFPDYSTGYLASYSDPHEGTIEADEIKNITYLYPYAKVYVIYHPNSGIGDARVVSVTQDTFHTVVDQGYTKELYEFANWNTMPDGSGFDYYIGGSIFMSDNIVLYARWKRVF